MHVGDDRGMVEAVLAGENELYRGLMEKYQGLVVATIARMVGRRPEVEDLSQETFWQAYRSLGRYRGESRFSTWLLRIAVNKSLDFLRRSLEEKRSLTGLDQEVNRAQAVESLRGSCWPRRGAKGWITTCSGWHPTIAGF